MTGNPKNQITFVVIGDPMGKPRMTRRDVWKKREVVLRYRDYCDRIREAAPTKLLSVDAYAIDIIADIAMPASWSQKKKDQHADKICRSRPDWDNIGKAVCDALFKEDSMLGVGCVHKYWCREGDQRTEIKVWFNA